MSMATEQLARWAGGALLLFALLVTGCRAGLQAPFKAPHGGLFMNVKAPLSLDFNHTRVVTDSGSVHSYRLYEPFYTRADAAWSTGAIARAAEMAGLDTIEYADYHRLRILGIASRITIHVYGTRDGEPIEVILPVETID